LILLIEVVCGSWFGDEMKYDESCLAKRTNIEIHGGRYTVLDFGIALPRFREQIEVFACGELLGADATSL
jgi:hypothetical protein